MSRKASRAWWIWMSVWIWASVAHGGPNYSLRFSSSRETYSWAHSFSMNPTIGNKLTFSSSVSLNSTLNRRKKDYWRDVNSSTLSISYPFSDRIRLSVNLFLNRQKDDLSRNKRPILTQQFSSRISWKPFPILSISQSAGGASDRRLGVKDRGVIYSTNISLSPKLGRNWSASFSFSKSGNSLKREDRNMNINGSLKYNAWAKPSLRFSESRQLRKYYRTKKGQMLLESLKSRSRQVSMSLSPPPIFGVRLNASGSYSDSRREDSASRDPKSAKFGSDMRGRHWELSGEASWALLGGRWPMRYRASYSRDLSDYDKSSLDKVERNLHMGFQTGFGITPTDSISASTSARIRRTDTPDPAEYNDWDHLTEELRVSYSHAPPSGLNLTIAFSTHRSHTVYLSGRRSAENKWSRQYSLSADLRYKLGKASISQRYEIGANYTQYDYDDRLNPTSPKSTVYRRASMSHRLNFPLGKATLSGSYALRTGDSGPLYSGLIQAVTREEATQTIGVSCSYPLAKSIPFSFSYSYTRSREYKPTAEGRKPSRDSRSRKLSANLSYKPGGSNSLQANGGRTVQYIWGRRIVRWNLSVSFTHTF